MIKGSGMVKTSTPLQKCDDRLTVADFLHNDQKLVECEFMSQMMVKHKTDEEIKREFEERFCVPISTREVNSLKKMVRAVYLTSISQNRDEMVAEELMHAEWELRELTEYWERSKKKKKTHEHHVSHSEGENGVGVNFDLDEERDFETEQIGDLDAMKYIGKVRERIIRVMGLEAPKKAPEGANDAKSGKEITINIVGRRNETLSVEEAEVVQ